MLTNKELIAHLAIRSDLTDLESDLVHRLTELMDSHENHELEVEEAKQWNDDVLQDNAEEIRQLKQQVRELTEEVQELQEQLEEYL